MMPSPHSLSAGEQGAEYFIELVLDTLQQLTPEVQGLFPQKFPRSLAGVEVPESESIGH
jgi:hypothetical protein